MASMLRDRPSSRLGTPSRSPIGTPPRSPSPWFAGTPTRSPIGTPKPQSLPWFDDYRLAAAGPSLEQYSSSAPTPVADPGSPGPSGFSSTPKRITITIMGRELEIVDVRTPHGPHEGTNNWGGASPLLSVNVPKESLGSSYLKFSASSDDDDDDDAGYDDHFRGSPLPPPVVTKDRHGDGGEKKRKKKRGWILAKLGWKKKEEKEKKNVVVLEGGGKSSRGWRPRWAQGW